MGIVADLGAGIDVVVPIDRESVRRLARSAATAATGWSSAGGVVGRFAVRELRAAERGVTFAVSAPSGRQLLLFRVEDEATETGTVVRVGIGEHLESQTRGAFGIPTDRRRVAGFPAYVKFVNALGASLAGA